MANGRNRYYIIGLAMAAGLAYLFIAPKLVKKSAAGPAAGGAGPSPVQVKPASIPAEHTYGAGPSAGLNTFMGPFSARNLGSGAGNVPGTPETMRFAGAAYDSEGYDNDYSYADIGVSDYYPYKFRLTVS